MILKAGDMGDVMEKIVADALSRHGVVFDSIKEWLIEDAFVLRSSDLFGSAGLFAYAHTIQTGLEMDRARPGSLTDEERMRLQVLADDVVQLGLDWQRTSSRIPD